MNYLFSVVSCEIKNFELSGLSLIYDCPDSY